MYDSKIGNVVHLREHLIEEWNNFHHMIIVSAIEHWRLRLRACVLGTL